MNLNSDKPESRTNQNSIKLLASSSVVSFWTFISRILGLARDIAFTSLLGAGVALDAYVVITKIPNVFRRVFAEGAFNQAFVPVLSEYKENNSENEVKVLINNIFISLIISDCVNALLPTVPTTESVIAELLEVEKYTNINSAKNISLVLITGILITV